MDNTCYFWSFFLPQNLILWKLLLFHRPVLYVGGLLKGKSAKSVNGDLVVLTIQCHDLSCFLLEHKQPFIYNISVLIPLNQDEDNFLLFSDIGHKIPI